MLIPITIGFLLGTLIATQCSSLLLWGLFAIVLLSLPSRLFFLKILISSFLLGLLYTEYFIQSHKTPEFLKQQDNQIISLQGKVVGLPYSGYAITQFDWQVQQAKIRVLWHNASFMPHAGDVLTASVQIRRPKALMNPYHDERRLWLLQGIHATGKVVGPVELVASYWTLDHFRERIAQKAQKIGKTLKTWPLIEALVLGTKKNIVSGDRQTFQKTGTSHLMAISGLHIGLIAGIGFFMGQRMARYGIPAVLHTVPSKIFGGGFACLLAVIYAALAGFSIPTQRALIMIVIGLMALLMRINVRSKECLALAGLLVLLWDPLSLQSPGFWLSFGAVGWLLYTASNGWGRVQGVLFLGLMPLTVWYFHSFSWISPVANVIAIPWSSFMVVPTAFFGFMLLPISETGALFLWKISDLGLKYLLICLHWLEQLPSPLISWEASLTACILASIGTLFLYLPSKIPGRWIGLFFWLPFFFPIKNSLKEGEANILLFDIGQGLAVSIETAHHQLLYDLGPKTGVIVPYLEKKHLKVLDTIVISHFDQDHAGGLPAVRARWPVHQAFSSDLTQDWPADFCRQGLTWTWDGVVFEFLHPDQPTISKKRNNGSCVLKMQAGMHSLLLTGDIEASVEDKLVKNKTNLKASILLVPHHGSLTSSSLAFIKAVNPQIALISSGRYNAYRHPRPAIVERYQTEGIQILDTAQLGAIELQLHNKGPVKIHHYSGGKLENLWYTW